MPDIKTISDEALLDLIAGKLNAERAFEELYSRHWSGIYLLAYNRLRSREACEEIVQDFFTSLWLKRENLKLRNSFKVYMNNAIRYNVINHWQKEQVRIKYRHSLGSVAPHGNSTEETVAVNDLARIINDEVVFLPERCRMVYELSRKGFKTNKEIANELGISEKTVENQLSKALKRLRLTLNHAISLWPFL